MHSKAPTVPDVGSGSKPLAGVPSSITPEKAKQGPFDSVKHVSSKLMATPQRTKRASSKVLQPIKQSSEPVRRGKSLGTPSHAMARRSTSNAFGEGVMSPVVNTLVEKEEPPTALPVLRDTVRISDAKPFKIAKANVKPADKLLVMR